MKYLILLLLLSTSAFAQSSMRRCTLLPVTDSVGGAIGFKVFEQVETDLKQSNWCTYISNSGMMSIFSRYRDNLPQYLKNREVLVTVADKLKVGSIVRVTLVNELKGPELSITVHGENGEDIYFSESTLLKDDEIETISATVRNWLDMYSKMIPYDAKINGVLGEQVTMDVGKGYPIQVGQKFIVKRLIGKKKHPLLKKVVDWQTVTLAEGSVFNISENQALGQIRSFKDGTKLLAGDWIRLEEFKPEDDGKDPKFEEEKEEPGTLGLLTLQLFGSSSSVNTVTATGMNRWGGNLLGLDVRAEGWITRQYFAAVEIMRSLGGMKRDSGQSKQGSLEMSQSTYKVVGGYKYLPIGFFYGPQIDLYGGYANHSFNQDYVPAAGLGQQQNIFSGFLLGVGANIPINREYRVFTHGEFMPFPGFTNDDPIYGDADSVTSLELELGVKYQYTVRMTLDASFEMRTNRAKFGSTTKELNYKDNFFKFGGSFNF